MVKNYYYQQGRHIPTLGLVPKVARTMKLTCLLLCLSIGFVFANLISRSIRDYCF